MHDCKRLLIRSHSGQLTRQTAVPLRWILHSWGCMVGCISFTVWVLSVNWRAIAGFCLKGVIQQKHWRPPITFHWESQRTWERTRTSAVSGMGGENLNYSNMYFWGGHVMTWRASLWETWEESWSSTLTLLITLSELLQVSSTFFLLYLLNVPFQQAGSPNTIMFQEKPRTAGGKLNGRNKLSGSKVEGDHLWL